MSTRVGGSGSSRWCPTQEQIVILEEMYRGGIRTPNASQIQNITSQLSFYGKIEGKNVFYWFQNHKARDRQKLRRRLNKQLQLEKQQQHHQLFNYYLQHFNHNHNNHHLYSHHWPMETLLTSSPSSSSSLYHSLAPFPEVQQGGAREASKQGMGYKWGIENTEGGVMMEENTWKEDYWRRRRMEESQASADSYWPTTRTLKTLELFPITERIKQM